MIGYSWSPSPPTASETGAGKLGRFLQVVVVDSRLIPSQLLMGTLPVIVPPHTSIFENP
jgi:hypothetical protein